MIFHSNMPPCGSLSRITLAAVLTGFFCSAAGQSYYPVETHGKEIDHASKVIALPGFGAFGESTDYSSGTTIFRKAIVEIPGSNNLRVAADYVVRLVENFGVYYSLERDLPYIEGTHSADYGWIVGKAPGDYTRNRCSDPRASYFNGGAASVINPKNPQDVIVPKDYWDGNMLYTPDAGGGIVRPIGSEESRPSGFDIKWATNDGWRFSCYALPDGTEGFIGHRPNGDKYYFGIPVHQWHNTTILSQDFPDADGGLEVDQFRMYVTRIEDRFGNWVNYEADRIVSSDGRVIELVPNSALGSAGAVIQAGGKQWTISGAKSMGPSATPNGSFSITNPDSSTWSFSVTGGISPYPTSLANSCMPEANIPLGYTGQMTVTVRTESNASGTFVFQPRRHGFSYVTFECIALDSIGKQTYSNYMHFIDRVALVSRNSAGPGIPDYSYSIDYGPISACYNVGAAPNTPNPCSSSSPTNRTTTITGSDGSVRTLTFGNRFNQSTGLLLAKGEGGLKSTAFEYVGLFSTFGGLGKRVPGYDVTAFAVYRVRKETTTLQGRAFVMEVPSTCGTDGASPCFDSYFRPTKIARFSAPAP